MNHYHPVGGHVTVRVLLVAEGHLIFNRGLATDA
jgi:hypothetical protein